MFNCGIKTPFQIIKPSPLVRWYSIFFYSQLFNTIKQIGLFFKLHVLISALWFIYFAYFFSQKPRKRNWLKWGMVKKKRVKLDKLTGAKFSLGFKVYQAHACFRFRNVKTWAFIILLFRVCPLADDIIQDLYPSLDMGEPSVCTLVKGVYPKTAVHHLFFFSFLRPNNIK